MAKLSKSKYWFCVDVKQSEPEASMCALGYKKANPDMDVKITKEEDYAVVVPSVGYQLELC